MYDSAFFAVAALVFILLAISGWQRRFRVLNFIGAIVCLYFAYHLFSVPAKKPEAPPQAPANVKPKE
jgi:threonine/homoserine/homoserine lactone efflux protein